MRFTKYTKFLNMADKCGFILRLVEPGINPLHDVQISTFYQRDKPGLEELYTVEFRRAPIPKLETSPWKVRFNSSYIDSRKICLFEHGRLRLDCPFKSSLIGFAILVKVSFWKITLSAC